MTSFLVVYILINLVLYQMIIVYYISEFMWMSKIRTNQKSVRIKNKCESIIITITYKLLAYEQKYKNMEEVVKNKRFINLYKYL